MLKRQERGTGQKNRHTVQLFACTPSTDISLVVDRDRMAEHEIAELVMVAISDTDTIFRAANASVQVKGHGYMVTLPPAEDAGFRDGDTAPVIPAPNMLVIVHGKREAHNGTSELADALHTIRNEQYSQ